MTTKPTYLPAKHLATLIGINPTTIHRIIRKWRNHPDNPCPTPDAYFELTFGLMPLWLPHRLPEWIAWKERRDTIVAELQAQERANALIREALQENPTQLHLLGPNNE